MNEPFDKIEVYGGGTVLVESGSSSAVALVDGDDLRAQITAVSSALRFHVSSGKLYVVCPAPCREDMPRTVRVTTPTIASIRLMDGGKVEIAQGFASARMLRIDITDGGTANASSFGVESIIANIERGGDATVFALRRLSGRIASGGKLKYFGDPEVLVSTTGVGVIEKFGSTPPHKR